MRAAVKKIRIKKIIVSATAAFFLFSCADVYAWKWLDDLSARIKIKKEAYDEIVQKNLSLRERIELLLKENDDLKAVHQSFLSKLGEMTRENDSLQKGVTALNTNLVEEKLNSERLRNSKDALAVELTSSTARMVKLEQALKRKNINALLDAASRQTSARYEKKLKEQKALAGRSEDVLKEQIVFFQKKAKSLERKLLWQEKKCKLLIAKSAKNYESQIALLKKQSDEDGVRLKDEKDFFGKGQLELESRVKAYEDRLAVESKNFQELKGANSILESQISQLKDTVTRINAEKEKLNKENASMKAFYEDSISRLKAEIAELEKENKSSQEELDKLRDSNVKLGSEVKELSGQKENFAKEIRESKDSYEQVIKNLKEKLTDSDKEKKEIGGKIGKFKYDASVARHDKEVVLKENREYSLSNTMLREESRQAVAKIDSLEDNNKRLTLRTTDLNNTLKTSRRLEEQVYARFEELKLQADRERVDMHYNMGIMFEKGGRYKDAEREYLKAIAINSFDAGAHYNLGVLYEDYLNEPAKAIYYYKRYLELNPDGQHAYKVKEWILHIEEKIRLGTETK